VSDVEKSADWYGKVFGLQRLEREPRHNEDERGGYAVLLVDPATGLLIGLHHHAGFHGGRFDERRAGLDHIAWGVSSREDLNAWAEWLTALNVEHSGVIDMATAHYSCIVLRDPDNIQLEIFHRHVTPSG
jgi:catechol 2,3-dioxygenase-like lactoylglutathione lyase family enzyme